jgi:predicted nucleic acid-binding protein
VIVLCDTSPLNYLLLTGYVDALPSLFGKVVIPAAVLTELQHAGSPQEIRQWLNLPHAWLEVRSAREIDSTIHLGPGECEAISLAVEMHATLLLMDDRKGRREAILRGLTVAGTLNILAAAAKKDLLDLPTAIAKLRKTNFHIAELVVQRALQSDALRRKNSSGN